MNDITIVSLSIGVSIVFSVCACMCCIKCMTQSVEVSPV